ncbi:hypothetical protein FRC14_004882 [Serendipita sp. 396]|nr:hypothetical protein FRC14_004882 [Serendipita sp. 396]KAG8781507.1 hypothetical protein FRC15_008613 [Serendipita sp. 397]KAG8866395.1 hypothetical protein FRC20_008646 [Serendipita sp. 405]
MTSKESGPKYRYTSEVEDAHDADKICDKIFGQVTVTVPLLELLSLSPHMRKQIAEITKTKRMPTSIVPKSVNAQYVTRENYEENEEEEVDNLVLALPIRPDDLATHRHCSTLRSTSEESR